MGILLETEAAIALRACACSFCRQHGARTTTDPQGRVALRVRVPERLVRYRFGARTADFLLCGLCGVYVAALFEERATVNANVFDEPVGDEAMVVSYEGEDAEQRRARRRARWTPVVETLQGLDALRAELVSMSDWDLAVREGLAREGSLLEGYHPRMEAVHLRNAARVDRILDDHGWPDRSLVGQEAGDAAWLLVQHAISDPPLMRRSLSLVRDAVASGEASPVQSAMLEDRILTLEGRPQLYGTQFDWSSSGRLEPLPVDDTEKVDERRAALGLDPLAERTRTMRESAARAGEPKPDLEARNQELQAWLRRVGWRAQ